MENSVKFKGVDEIREKNIFKKKNIWPYLLLLPSSIFYLIFFVFPALHAIYLSFYDWNPLTDTKVFEGLSNYKELFNDPVFMGSLTNTIKYVFYATACLVILPLIVSMCMDNLTRGKSLFRTLIYIPEIIAMSVGGMMWQFVLNPTIGVASQISINLGHVPVNWLGDTRYALGVIIFVGIWRSFGNNVLLYTAGLQSVPNHLKEAARVDGAREIEVIRYVLLPGIKNTLIFVIITTIIACFQVFTLVQVMTMGGPNNATNMLVFQIWQEAFQFFDMGRSNAISSILFVLLFILTLFMLRVTKTSKEV